MGEYDMKRLEVAIQYISRMAAGRNPVTNRPAPENDVLINPNVNRCLQFIGEILQDVKSTGGIVGRPSKKTRGPVPSLPQSFPYEILENFRYREDQQISFFLRQISELFPEGEAPAIQATLITDWLREKGYLVKRRMEGTGRVNSVPTEKGMDMGLYAERGGTAPNEYYRVFYNQQAQQFLIDHFREILTESEQIRARRRQERGGAKKYEQRKPVPEPMPEQEDPAFSSLLASLAGQDVYGTAQSPGAEFFGDGWEKADEDLPW